MSLSVCLFQFIYHLVLLFSPTVLAFEGSNSAVAGSWEHCPNDELVVGFKAKVAPKMDIGDNTALNGIKFQCQSGSTIASSEGSQGTYSSDYESCPTGYSHVRVAEQVSPIWPTTLFI